MNIKETVIDAELTNSLIPINTYQAKLNIKQKMCCIIKRGLDILAGLVGAVILVPLTLAIYIAHKITKDERTNFL